MKTLAILLGLSLISCTAVRDVFDPITEADKKLLEESSLNFEPLPVININEMDQIARARIELGKKLYLDPRLSSNDQISCNSCHKLDQFGVDNKATSPGHNSTHDERNSPSSFNAFLHIAQFWDGRAKDVEEQALADRSVIDKLKKVPEYVAEFKQAFPTEKAPLKYRNIGIAIGAFERTLVTPSAFDDYLRGNIRALSNIERRGLQKFTEIGCVTCHNGSAVGGGMYQKLGAVEDYPYVKDVGLFGVTKNEDDKFFFKVPSLRNVAKTGPWFHDGSITDLNEAIRIMARYQLGTTLTPEDVADIRAFLESLTGEVPENAHVN